MELETQPDSPAGLAAIGTKPVTVCMQTESRAMLLGGEMMQKKRCSAGLHGSVGGGFERNVLSPRSHNSDAPQSLALNEGADDEMPLHDNRSRSFGSFVLEKRSDSEAIHSLALEEGADARVLLHRGNSRSYKSFVLKRSRSDAMQSLALEEGEDARREVLEEEAAFFRVGAPQSNNKKTPPADAICGMDKRPFYPLALFVSTILGAICMLHLQCPMILVVFPRARFFPVFFIVLYIVTLSCMVYAALCDPGQMSREWQEGDDLPKRAHKTWLYKRPILRFDHYCRWLTNVIGLQNHREFMVMIGSLTFISFTGAVVDVVLIGVYFPRGFHFAEFILLVHLAYSLGVGKNVAQIFWLHLGFVSRNELAREWKNDDFRVLWDAEGGMIPVKDLSEEEQFEFEDDFEYESSLNPFDQGWRMNCTNFWCIPRWAPGQRGEF